MLYAWAQVLLGLVILLLAGDVLVRGAVNIALRLGISALIVSLTVVAFGTSAPELLIALRAVTEGAADLALGNVVGSNVANILLVLGVPALVSTLDTTQCDTRRSYIYMLGATVLFIALATVGVFAWWSGLVLLAGLTFILLSQFNEARTEQAADTPVEKEDNVEGADPDMPWWKIGVFTALGMIGLPVGADLLVDGAVEIATTFGMSETVIGLTLIAVGTSLPELATTVMAALRRQGDVAIGNVIGSNIFNLLAIIGVTALVAPVTVASEFFVLDFWVMLGASLLLIPFVFMNVKMGRVVGALLTLTYVGYVGILLT